MKPATLGTALRTLAVGVFFAGAQFAQAASIGLTPPPTSGPDPDLVTYNAAINYQYVAICKKSATSTQMGVCSGTFKGPQQWNLSYGKMTVTGTTMALNPGSNLGLYQVTSGSQGLSYNLTVIFGFNSSGVATNILASDPWSGDALYSSNVTAKGQTTAAGYGGPVIVSGTPINATLPPFNEAYNFGYAGTSRAGIFEFVFQNVGGNYANTPGGQNQMGGIIGSTFNLCRGTLTVSTGACSKATPTGTWDSQSAFWKSNFQATGNFDTFVPVPAAVWLFGSALAGLTVARRRKSAVSAVA